MGWNDRLLADVRRHRRAYRALFAASVVIAVFAATFVGAATASAREPVAEEFGLGVPFVAFPVLYAALLWRLLRATGSGRAPEAT